MITCLAREGVLTWRFRIEQLIQFLVLVAVGCSAALALEAQDNEACAAGSNRESGGDHQARHFVLRSVAVLIRACKAWSAPADSIRPTRMAYSANMSANQIFDYSRLSRTRRATEFTNAGIRVVQTNTERNQLAL